MADPLEVVASGKDPWGHRGNFLMGQNLQTDHSKKPYDQATELCIWKHWQTLLKVDIDISAEQKQM